MPQLTSPTTKPPSRPNMTTSTIICALLAAGLAVALSREHRIRRAFEILATRLLEKIRGRDSYPHRPTNTQHSRRRR